MKVDAPSGNATEESGAPVSVAIGLAGPPPSALEVYGVSSNTQEAVVSAPVRFTAASWREKKTLTITGVDDDQRDGDVPYQVTLYARWASDAPAHGWPIAVLSLLNRDDDAAHFQGLGDLPGGDYVSHASALSADGRVVVGSSADAQGERAVQWTASGGLLSLGGVESRAVAVSADGHSIVGSVAEPSFAGGRAGARFAVGQAYQLIRPAPEPQNPPPLMWFVEGSVVLNDGAVYGTCTQFAAYGEPIGCRAAGASSVDLLVASHVYAANAAGLYAGTLHAERHAPFSSRAVFNGGPIDYVPGVLCDPPTGCQAEGRAFSEDGSVLVGTSWVPRPGQTTIGEKFATGFVFTQAQGVRPLPDLAGGDERTGAYAIRADGRVIGGFGHDASGQRAVLWIDGVPHALEQLLRDAGAVLPAGWALLDVRAMTPDGRVFVGEATNPDGRPEAYRAALAHAP